MATKIEGWMASHINCKERVGFLEASLKSLINQKESKLSKICFSYSIDELFRKSLEDDITKILKKVSNFAVENKIPFEFKKHKIAKTQFEHYQCIATEFLHFEDGWVLFSDDDDISHEKRLFCFQKAIKGRRDQDVFCVAGFDEHIGGSYWGNYEELDWKSKDFDNLNTNEYFSHVVKIAVVFDFFTSVKPQVIAHRFCDLAFVSFVMHYPKCSLSEKVGFGQPLYFQRVWDSTKQSSECVTDETPFKRICKEKKDYKYLPEKFFHQLESYFFRNFHLMKTNMMLDFYKDGGEIALKSFNRNMSKKDFNFFCCSFIKCYSFSYSSPWSVNL